MGRKKKPDERRAGLSFRRAIVINFYGGPAEFSRTFDLNYNTVISWGKLGHIPHTVATMVHARYVRDGEGFTAKFCRPDLRWRNGKLLCNPGYGSVEFR